jgi:hypothetical protein
MEVAMSMHSDHHTEHHEPNAMLPMLWIGAALVAIVAFSYWLNM